MGGMVGWLGVEMLDRGAWGKWGVMVWTYRGRKNLMFEFEVCKVAVGADDVTGSGEWGRLLCAHGGAGWELDWVGGGWGVVEWIGWGVGDMGL